MTSESPHWFKSSYSSDDGACVEVATNFTTTHGIVPVRDSKAPTGPTLNPAASAYSSFVTAIRAGRLRTP